jgi:hypothetical protein
LPAWPSREILKAENQRAAPQAPLERAAQWLQGSILSSKQGL